MVKIISLGWAYFYLYKKNLREIYFIFDWVLVFDLFGFYFKVSD